MKRAGTLLIIFAALCAAVASSVPARSARAVGATQAPPRDVREIFLTLPFPAHPSPDSVAEYYAEFIDTLEKRRRLLEQPYTKPGEYENTLDLANGYLRLNLNDNWGQYATVTYFTRADGTRLVVLQLGLENQVEYDPHTEDYFYTLTADGRYAEVAASDVLPPITFEDFWGERPLPPASVRQMFAEEHLYNIEWPRRGTTAVVRSYPPFNTSGKVSGEERKAKEAYGRRSYATMELVWDKQRGLFTKGAKAALSGSDKTWAKGPSLPSLCSGEEFDMFNCAIVGSGKLLSICASKSSALEQGRGYVQYRFGRPGRVELEFPRERRGYQRAFTLVYSESSDPGGPVRRSASGALTFLNGGYRYTVRETFRMGERPEDAEKNGWVEVAPAGGANASGGAVREFRCLDPVQGTLGNLRRYVAQAPGR